MLVPLLIATLLPFFHFAFTHNKNKGENENLTQELVFDQKGEIFQSLSNINISMLESFQKKTFSSTSTTECALLCLMQGGCMSFFIDLKENKCDLFNRTMKSEVMNACPHNYSVYAIGSKLVCFKVIISWHTRDSGISACSQDGGRLASLAEDDKHTAAAQIAENTLKSNTRILWIDALLNSTTLTWHWPDGTRVNEDRFSKNGNFYEKNSSKPCVFIMDDLYWVAECSRKGNVLCEI